MCIHRGVVLSGLCVYMGGGGGGVIEQTVYIGGGIEQTVYIGGGGGGWYSLSKNIGGGGTPIQPSVDWAVCVFRQGTPHQRCMELCELSVCGEGEPVGGPAGGRVIGWIVCLSNRSSRH